MYACCAGALPEAIRQSGSWGLGLKAPQQPCPGARRAHVNVIGSCCTTAKLARQLHAAPVIRALSDRRCSSPAKLRAEHVFVAANNCFSSAFSPHISSWCVLVVCNLCCLLSPALRPHPFRRIRRTHGRVYKQIACVLMFSSSQGSARMLASWS